MATVDQLYAQVQSRFADKIERSTIACGELTLEIPAQHLRDISLVLRDDSQFDFKLLIDVCGVDYLHYGISEWETQSATFTGFSRGVEINPHPTSNPPIFKGGEDLSDGAIPPANTIDIPLVSTRIDASPETENTSNPVDGALPPFEKGKDRFAKHRFASVYHLLSLEQNHRIRLRVFIDANHLRVPSVTDIWPAANWFEREAFDLFGIIYEGHPDLRRILTDYGFVGHPFRKDFPLIGKVEARYDAKTSRVVYENVSIQPRILEPKVIRSDNRYQENGA